MSSNIHPANDSSEALPAAQAGAPAYVTTGAAAGTKKYGACTNCRERKVRCQFANAGDDACIRCTRGGDACIVQESRTRCASRGKSAPPADLLSQESRIHNDNMTRKSRKRSGSQVPCSLPSQPSKQHRQSGSQECVAVIQSRSSKGPARNPFLNSIPEIGGDQDHFDIDSDVSNSLEHGANNFLSALSTGESQLEDDFHAEPHEDVHCGLDDDVDASGRPGDDSDEMEDEINFHTTRPSQPAAQQALVKQKQDKSTSQRKPTTEPAISQDPQTCSFTIQCAVRRPNSANAPFEITSDASLGDICMAVAQRLDRFPGSVSLQYRLDCDKAKGGCTSIRSLDELDMFKARLRGLIVPQRLPNGKISTRAPKKVVVYFEDAGIEISTSGDLSGDSLEKAGATSRQQVAKQKSAGSNDLVVEGTSLHKDLIQQLQERWRCDTHSSGPENAMYCYRPPGSTSACYPLTYSHMLTWAIGIARNNATLDDKPVTTMEFQAATGRPRSRSRTATRPLGSSPGTYGYPPPPVIQVMPPSWVPPGFQGSGTGALYPAAPNQSYPSPHAATMSLPRTSLTSVLADVPVQNIPNVVDWFPCLDQHPQRNQDEITYAPFGPILKKQGFFRISQLMSDHVNPEHLVKWLGIEFGVAVLIFQYAEQDLAAIRSGKRILMDS